MMEESPVCAAVFLDAFLLWGNNNSQKAEGHIWQGLFASLELSCAAP